MPVRKGVGRSIHLYGPTPFHNSKQLTQYLSQLTTNNQNATIYNPNMQPESIRYYLVKILNHKCKPHGGTRGKAGGKTRDLAFILWGP